MHSKSILSWTKQNTNSVGHDTWLMQCRLSVKREMHKRSTGQSYHQQENCNSNILKGKLCILCTSRQCLNPSQKSIFQRPPNSDNKTHVVHPIRCVIIIMYSEWCMTKISHHRINFFLLFIYIYIYLSIHQHHVSINQLPSYCHNSNAATTTQ